MIWDNGLPFHKFTRIMLTDIKITKTNNGGLVPIMKTLPVINRKFDSKNLTKKLEFSFNLLWLKT
jgi:hypothetical protein